MEEQQVNNALAVQGHKPLLMERMASQYGMDPAAFKSVLLKTVFPADKQVSMEQLAMFCIVAHNYSLNPLLREIYAFPSKGGGIIPVLGYDGWVTIIQRQPDYDGCEYEYVWVDGKVGGAILGVTCIIYRKKHSRPTKKTVWFSEVKRETDQWKQKPVWMTEIKALIQTARLAYGFGGIYDQDEAENILEAQLRTGADGVMRSEIQMPKRQEQITAGTQTIITPNNGQWTVTHEQPITVTTTPGTVIVGSTTVIPEDAQVFDTETDDGQPKDYGFGATPAAAEETTQAIDIPTGEDLFDAKPEEVKPATATGKATIGAGRAKRIRAIAFSKKTRTEEDYKELMAAFKITDLADYPMSRHKELENWAEGK